MNIEKEKYEEIIKCLYSARISLMNFSCIVSEYISIYYAMELQNDISNLIWIEKELRELKGRLDYE